MVRVETQSVWWTGDERDSLKDKKAANLADQAAAHAGAVWPGIQDWPELNDGYVVHAPVGTYAANAFGLHEIHGNLWEWCRDGHSARFYARSPSLDPLNPPQGPRLRVYRGGGFNSPARAVRSAIRHSNTPTSAHSFLGVRPAQGIATD